MVRGGVGPLSEGSLDEAFSLAIGARSVRAGEAVLHMLAVQQLAKQLVFVAGAVVREHPSDGDAEAGVVGTSHEEEAHGRVVRLIGQDGREGDTAVIVDGHVQILVTGPAGLFAAISGDAVSRFLDARQALDVEVNQLAGMLVLIAHHRRGRIERTQAVQPGAAQNPTYRGPAQLQFAGDLPAVAALPAKFKNLFQ